jgi:hypothetical protein
MSAARLVPVVRSRVATSAAPASVTLRSISTTARLEKGPVDATKDTLKAADRVVSDAAVKGIDLGRTFIPPLNQNTEDSDANLQFLPTQARLARRSRKLSAPQVQRPSQRPNQ